MKKLLFWSFLDEPHLGGFCTYYIIDSMTFYNIHSHNCFVFCLSFKKLKEEMNLCTCQNLG